MRISIKWLEEYVNIPWDPEETADRLTAIGAKVEGVHSLKDDLENIVVGRVVEIKAHPSRADLSVCQVDIGERTVQTVTGAPNVQQGMLAPVAIDGVALPSTGQVVTASELAGVTSEAIVCSERELSLSDDHSGIMELPTDAAVGASVVHALGLDDTVLEFETYPNRADCLSVLGMAREVAAITGGSLRLPEPDITEEGDDSVERWMRVEVREPKLCPRYMARVITDVQVGPSPAWIQQRLRSAGMRPINNIVDATNYCMLELGQPLHAFDHKLLSDDAIVVRTADEGETIQTLDGEMRTPTDETLLICDADKPVALAGIMGGANSEVSLSTTTIVLESANFDPVNVRKSAKHFGLSTEASYRFERDLDPHLPAWALDRAAGLIAQLAGGRIVPGHIDVSEPLSAPRIIEVRPDRVNAVLGTKLSPAEMKRILKSLGFQVDIKEEAALLHVEVPSYRRDVLQEVDLLEEIARIHGFDKIEATFAEGSSLPGGLNDTLAGMERARRTLAAFGCYESLTYSFISPKLFDRLALPDDHPWRQAIPLENPISEEYSVMRTALLPSLLQACALNQRRHIDDVRLFELSRVYVADALPLETLPEERPAMGLVLTGEATTDVWGAPGRNVDFYDLKGVIEGVAEAMRIEVGFTAGAHPSFHPGRTARVLVEEEDAGVYGEIHPEVAAAFGLRGRVYAAEIDFERWLQAARAPVEYRALARFPAVERDLALLVPQEVLAERVQELIRAHGGDHLHHVRLFDVYEGDRIPSGHRSLAFSLTFRSDERTLTDDEVVSAQQEIERALEQELSVHVRT